jgi:HEAT repeat protein
MRSAAVIALLLPIAAYGAGPCRAADAPTPGKPPPAAPAAPAPAAATSDGVAGLIAELQSSDVARRKRAAYALFGLGPAARNALPALADALRDDDEYVRTVADKVLATFRMEKAFGALEAVMPELLVGLADPRVEVRRLASGNLWRIGWPTKPPPATLAPALIRAFQDPDAAVRARVAGVVVYFAGHLPETYDALKPLATDADAGVRLWSLQALGTLRSVDSAPLMIAALSDSDATVRAVAAGNLGFPHARMAPAVPKLVTALSDSDADVRRAAAYSLAGLGQSLDTSSGVDRLLELLKDPDPKTQAAAAAGLESTGSPKMLATMLARLDGELPVEVRAAMVSALGGAGPEEASRVASALEAALQHEDESVQTSAATALQALGRCAASSIPALLGAVGDPSEQVRVAALGAVVAVGGRASDVVEKVMVALKFGSLRVRNAAANALVAIGREAKAAGPLAIDRLRDETDAGTRSMLLSFLAAIDAEPNAVLEAALAQAPSDPGGRVGTSFARARFSPSEADARGGLADLVAALDSEETRWQAVYALRLLGPVADGAVAKLEALAQADVAAHRSSSTYDLAILQIRGLAAKDAWARARATLAAGDEWSPSIFGELGAVAAPVVPELIAATGAKEISLRRAAFTALGKIGVSSDAVKAALDAGRRDPIASVRRAVYDAQSRLGLLPR